MEPDIVLVLDGPDGSSPIEVHAWHQVLTNASPYFRAMFAPGRFLEGLTLHESKHLRVPLPDTNAQAMGIVSDILHLQSDKVSADMTLDRLVEIMVVADKFECVKAIEPWLQIWMGLEKMKQEINHIEHMTIENLAKWVFICSARGSQHASENHLYELKNRLRADDLEPNVDKHLNRLSSSLLDDIRARRSAIAIELRAILEDFTGSLIQGIYCKAGQKEFIKDRAKEVFRCSSVHLGSILIAARHNFGSNWQSTVWPGSVFEMQKNMHGVADWLELSSLVKTKQCHRFCALSHLLRRRTEEILQKFGQVPCKEFSKQPIPFPFNQES